MFVLFNRFHYLWHKMGKWMFTHSNLICLDSLVWTDPPARIPWQAWSSIAGVSSSQIASKGAPFLCGKFSTRMCCLACSAENVYQKPVCFLLKGPNTVVWRVKKMYSGVWWACTSSRQFRPMFISVYIISYCFGKSAQRWLLEDAQRRKIKTEYQGQNGSTSVRRQVCLERPRFCLRNVWLKNRSQCFVGAFWRVQVNQK